jgi:hypothetical protein
MTGTLVEVIDRLDEIDDSDRFDPPVIYADGGSKAPRDARAVICQGDEEGTGICPLDPSLREVLMAELAKEAVKVWSAWRDGRQPGPDEKFEAVMYYSRHDAYLPIELG